MDLQRAKELLSGLADGVDPLTGEVLPENHVCNIIIESCIPSANEPFVPAIIHYVIEVIAKHLQEEYPNLMKVVWAN